MRSKRMAITATAMVMGFILVLDGTSDADDMSYGSITGSFDSRLENKGVIDIRRDTLVLQTDAYSVKGMIRQRVLTGPGADKIIIELDPKCAVFDGKVPEIGPYEAMVLSEVTKTTGISNPPTHMLSWYRDGGEPSVGVDEAKDIPTNAEIAAAICAYFAAIGEKPGIIGELVALPPHVSIGGGNLQIHKNDLY